jgi:hypothetical protein
MKKITRLTENDLERLVRKVIKEQKEVRKEIPIPEVLNKTVTFDAKCEGVSLGKIQLKIVSAKHMTFTSSNGTLRTLKFELTKLDGKKGNKFETSILQPNSNEIPLFNQDMGNYDQNETVAYCRRGVIEITSENLFNYIRSLKKYPTGRFPNEKLNLPKTDFQP